MKDWEPKRKKSAIILGIWAIFLLILIIIGMTSPKKASANNKDVQSDIDITSIINKFDYDNYAYVKTIKTMTEPKEEMTYEGEIKDKIITGYLETNTEIIKYRCENNICYNEKQDYQETLDEKYIPYELLNLKDNITSKRDKFIKVSDNKYFYQVENEKINLTLEEKKIVEITIENPEKNIDIKIK